MLPKFHMIKVFIGIHDEIQDQDFNTDYLLSKIFDNETNLKVVLEIPKKIIRSDRKAPSQMNIFDFSHYRSSHHNKSRSTVDSC